MRRIVVDIHALSRTQRQARRTGHRARSIETNLTIATGFIATTTVGKVGLCIHAQSGTHHLSCGARDHTLAVLADLTGRTSVVAATAMRQAGL